MQRNLLILALFLAGFWPLQAEEPFDYHTVRGRAIQPLAGGRFEGETAFELVGTSRIQGLRHYGEQWSGDSHLLWHGSVGESMTTSFELEEAGIFDIDIQFTVAPDYGLFELWWNGTKVQDDIDLYGTRVELASLLKLSEVNLPAGRQRLEFKLVGSNSKAAKFQDKGYLLGLDYIDLKRIVAPTPEGSDPPTPVKEKSVELQHTPRATATAQEVAEVSALFARYCFDCHRGEDAEGTIDMTGLTSRDGLLAEVPLVRRMYHALRKHEMPPHDAPQPTADERARLTGTLDALIDEYIAEHSTAPPIVMRRMNRFEYNNAVRDLLELQGDIYPLPEKTIRPTTPYFNPASGRFPHTVVVGNRTLGKNQVERQILSGVTPFAIDLQAEGGFNNRGEELSVSPILLESFLQLGQSIVHSPEFDHYCGLSSTLFEAPEGLTRPEQVRKAGESLAPLLERAFRAPVDPSTLSRYEAFFERQLTSNASFSQSMKTVVAAILASPRFLYLKTTSGDAPPSQRAYELASRLAMFLWSSIPDSELLEAARDGSLLQPDVLEQQVVRMIEDPRSQALSQNFARQWLRLDQLITAVPDFERFPSYYSRIGCEQWKFGLQTMIEPLLLFESIMVEDRSIMLLINANYSYRSDELQSWYQDAIPFGGRENRRRFNTGQQAFQRRPLPDRRQGGVITSAATLTMTSAPLRTSPIVRGAWVATVIFNQPPPPPPDEVPEIEADERAIEARGLTLRQRLVQHQVNAGCAACHSKIDPLGFALENFDAVGRWRDSYPSGLAIDASGTLFGQESFADVVQLKDAVLRNPEWFTQAFCEHLLSYALGRELELADRPAIENIVAAVLADRGQFTTVIREIVLSHPFRQ